MTKRTWTTPALSAANPNVNDFKRVCKELHDNLVSAGLVVADDTGQLNFEAITAYTSNKDYGYRIYRLNDGIALPVFLKIRFFASGSSTGSSGEIPWRFNLSIGLGSNGKGALVSPTAEIVAGASEAMWGPMSTPYTARDSFVCVTKGFVGVSLKQLSGEASATYGPSADDNDRFSLLSFFVCRDVNDAGEATANGVSLIVVAPGGITYENYGGAPVVT